MPRHPQEHNVQITKDKAAQETKRARRLRNEAISNIISVAQIGCFGSPIQGHQYRLQVAVEFVSDAKIMLPETHEDH